MRITLDCGFYPLYGRPYACIDPDQFNQWDFISPPTYIGLGNYQAMFNDELFFKSLKVTTTYTLLSVPLGLAGGLLVAMLMNQNLKGVTIFRTIYYLPSVIAGVAVALLWQWIFNPNYGLINGMLVWSASRAEVDLHGRSGSFPPLSS